MKLRKVGGEKLKYFALSYVWGRIPTIQLVKFILSQLSEPNSLRESFGELSNIVKDAISFTQELGERYLWADSLCICQDDIATKGMQNASMNIIYTQATMTLVA
jgi:hypothetical protein